MMKKFIIALTVIMLGVGAVWGWIMFKFIPDWWFPMYCFIPCFFYLMGLVQIGIVSRSAKKKSKYGVLNSVLLQRMIRWGILILVLVLMLVLSDPPKVSFLVSFMGFYMFFTFWEISLLSQITKIHKASVEGAENNDKEEVK